MKKSLFTTGILSAAVGVLITPLQPAQAATAPALAGTVVVTSPVLPTNTDCGAFGIVAAETDWTNNPDGTGSTVVNAGVTYVQTSTDGGATWVNQPNDVDLPMRADHDIRAPRPSGVEYRGYYTGGQQNYYDAAGNEGVVTFPAAYGPVWTDHCTAHGTSGAQPHISLTKSGHSVTVRVSPVGTTDPSVFFKKAHTHSFKLVKQLKPAGGKVKLHGHGTVKVVLPAGSGYSSVHASTKV